MKNPTFAKFKKQLKNPKFSKFSKKFWPWATFSKIFWKNFEMFKISKLKKQNWKIQNSQFPGWTPKFWIFQNFFEILKFWSKISKFSKKMKIQNFQNPKFKISKIFKKNWILLRATPKTFKIFKKKLNNPKFQNFKIFLTDFKISKQ